MRFFLPAAIALLLISCQTGTPDHQPFDDTQVTGLLELMDSLAARNPGFSEEGSGTDPALSARNESDTLLQGMISRLLGCPAYTIYFSRFRNLTSDDYRLGLNALPFGAAELPGNAGGALYELFRHRDVFGAWYRSVRDDVDIFHCMIAAREWLPRGARPVASVYAFYDGNAGSFAEQGAAFFNLCSEVVTKSPEELRFRNLDTIGANDLERVIAHELHHAMSEPILFPEEAESGPWQQRWVDRLARTIVSEGVAFRCNPLHGFQKELWEDRMTIATLIGELDRTMIALDAHEISEDSVANWNRGLYQEFASSLLTNYVRREWPDSAVASMVRERQIFRPDLPHVLGWWMVSMITRDGSDHAAAIDLLLSPSSLFRRYNEALSPDLINLAVDERVVRMVERTAE